MSHDIVEPVSGHRRVRGLLYTLVVATGVEAQLAKN